MARFASTRSSVTPGNLLGEYDFSAEKLRGSVGIRLPKLGAKKEVFLDLIRTDKPQCTGRIR